jgi:hypothetical protein
MKTQTDKASYLPHLIVGLMLILLGISGTAVVMAWSLNLTDLAAVVRDKRGEPPAATPAGDERNPPQWAAVEAHVGLNYAQYGIFGSAQVTGLLGRRLDPSATGGMASGGRNDVVPNDPTPSRDRPLE